MTYPRPDSNGGVIASKCLQGACIKREGKGGALHHLRKKQGGEAGLSQVAPPPAAGARRQQRPPRTLPRLTGVGAGPRPPAFATRLVRANDGKSEAFKWLPNPPGNRD